LRFNNVEERICVAELLRDLADKVEHRVHHSLV
jgi:hypothetical protein